MSPRYFTKFAGICMSWLLLQALSAEESYKLTNHGATVHMHVIELSAIENQGFELVDGAGPPTRYYADQHYDAEQHLLVINGGYFDANMKPVGRCQIGDQIHAAVPSAKLSGYLLLDETGRIELIGRPFPKGDRSHSVLQAGPFIIDPGGNVGIHSETGLPAKRTVIAVTADERVMIITTSEVTLYRLARLLAAKLPQIDRALNLDGGPSTALIYRDIKIENRNPVRNFLRKKRAPVASL